MAVEYTGKTWIYAHLLSFIMSKTLQPEENDDKTAALHIMMLSGSLPAHPYNISLVGIGLLINLFFGFTSIVIKVNSPAMNNKSFYTALIYRDRVIFDFVRRMLSH